MKITCDCKDTMNISELELFQGDIKKMTKKSRETIIKSLTKYGIMVPWAIWGKKVLDGTQRTVVLREDFNYTGDVPIYRIEAENEKEAREKLLSITSQTGIFNLDELEVFAKGLDLDTAHLVDGPNIDLNFKVDIKPPKPALIDDVEIVDSDSYQVAEVEEIKTETGEEITFPDGTVLIAGSDRYFAEEVVRMWNNRNKTKKVEFKK
jgi:hypothetical protein